ncbi:MAG: hypothetical protein WBG01_17685 [Bacteroidota bacterium]|jgi:hypothetical protein
MYCPECGYEYVEGIKECADCRVPLVEERPRQIRRHPKEFQEVLSTYNQADIALIKSILDDERVEYVWLGETFSQIGQLIQPATLVVLKEHVERTKETLSHLKVTFFGVTG